MTGPAPTQRLNPLLVVGGVVALIAFAAAGVAVKLYLDYRDLQRRRAECRTNLKAAFVAQKSFYAERDRYEADFAPVGFMPERGNRYAYVLVPNGPVQRRTPTGVTPGPFGIVGADERVVADGEALHTRLPSTLAGGVKPGLHGVCPSCEVVMACVGNVDRDETVDVWSISTAARVAPDGTTIPDGQPFNDVDDTRR